LISFPPGTEMFQFPGLSLRTYVFSTKYRRIAGGGFPHSGIRGSSAIQRLPAAYRSRSRPSSTPGAKASTVCPSYLDGDLTRYLLDCSHASGKGCATHETHAERASPVCWMTVQFSRSAKRGARGDSAVGLSKLNSMQAPTGIASRPEGPQSARAVRATSRSGRHQVRARHIDIALLR
jgi:hypothetical protein